jgi:hypothetical protein
MSLFSTKIPVDVSRVLALLPKDHFLHDITFNVEQREVEIIWDSERLFSGMTIPVPYPVSDLERKRLPDGVKDKTKKEKPPEAKPVPPPETVAAPPPPAPDYHMTQEQVADLFEKGDKLEFWGMTGQWKPVTKFHVYNESYHYRKIGVDKVAQPAV